MILTQEIIDSTITKLKYMIARKVVKYACNIAIGRKLNCLLKEIKLLRLYKEILCNFEIVGKPHTCTCVVPGDYNFNEIEINTLGDSQIQFLEDGTGTLVNPSGTYDITWGYQEGLLMINLPNDVVITYNTVTFDTECNIEFADQDNGYSYLATIDAPTDFEPYDGAYGVITVLKPDGTTILKNINYMPSNPNGNPAQEIIPSTLSGSQEIADYWNAQLPTSNLKIQYSSISEVFNMFTNYYNNYDYTDHIFKYVYCSNNGNPAYTTFVNSFSAPWTVNYTQAFGSLTIPKSQFFSGTKATMEFLITEIAMFTDSSAQSFSYDGSIMFTHTGNYANMSELVLAFNENNNQGFVMQDLGSFNVKITAPNVYPQAGYNTKPIVIEYFGASYEDDGGTFSGGITQTNSNIVIQDGINGIVYQLTPPYDITNITEFINDFNQNNTAGLEALLTSSSGLNYTVKITSPINTGWSYNTISLDYLYYATAYEFNTTYSNGVDPTTGKFIVTGTSPTTIYYEDLVSINYTGLQEFVDNFNNSPSNQGFTAEKIGAKDIKFTAPFESGADFNGELIYLAYNYDSVQYTDVNIDQELLNGVDPTFTTLTGNFAPSSVESSIYTNQNPCDDADNEQICLSNEQVIKIINYINKLNKK